MGVGFSGQAACTAKDSRAARALRRSRLGPLRCRHWRERASPFRIVHTYDPRLTLVIPIGLGFRASIAIDKIGDWKKKEKSEILVQNQSF